MELWTARKYCFDNVLIFSRKTALKSVLEKYTITGLRTDCSKQLAFHAILKLLVRPKSCVGGCPKNFILLRLPCAVVHFQQWVACSKDSWESQGSSLLFFHFRLALNIIQLQMHLYLFSFWLESNPAKSGRKIKKLLSFLQSTHEILKLFRIYHRFYFFFQAFTVDLPDYHKFTSLMFPTLISYGKTRRHCFQLQRRRFDHACLCFQNGTTFEGVRRWARLLFVYISIKLLSLRKLSRIFRIGHALIQNFESSVTVSERAVLEPRRMLKFV